MLAEEGQAPTPTWIFFGGKYRNCKRKEMCKIVMSEIEFILF
jgi:hypothetical protein